MRLAIMQPYFLPYIGYYQLVSAVDAIVVYDNIKYTKKGWINRNRILLEDSDVIFSLPLKKGSDSLQIAQREISAEFDRTKLLRQFKGAYRLAPYFAKNFAIIDEIVSFEEDNLFSYLYNSLRKICHYLDIKTEIIISSSVAIDHSLKSQDKVLALCDVLGAQTYINTIGGTELYDKGAFRSRGIDLQFLKAMPFEYAQFHSPFVPWLSIVDILMFNPLDKVSSVISANYDLI